MLLLLFWATQPADDGGPEPFDGTPATVRLTVAGQLLLELEVAPRAEVALTVTPRSVVGMSVAEE